MALAEFTHHSSRGQRTARVWEEVENATHNVLRHQKSPPLGMRPGCLADPEPQRGDRSPRRFAGDGLPTLALPPLAGSAAEAVDASTLTFLLSRNLELQKEKDEEEKRREKEEEEAKVVEELAQLDAELVALLRIPVDYRNPSKKRRKW